MLTISRIREIVMNFPRESLLTTRDLLHTGTRSAVDNAICQLVKTKQLTRVCRGVFAHPERTQAISVTEVATVKARSFGRQIIKHAASLASKLGLLDQESKQYEFCFATNGSTSSFRFNGFVIQFKNTSPRKLALANTNTGQVIRALCFLGKEKVSEQTAKNAAAGLERSDLELVPRLAAFMPSWLNSLLQNLIEKDAAAVSTGKHARQNRRTRPQSFSTPRVNESSIPYLAASISKSKIGLHQMSQLKVIKNRNAILDQAIYSHRNCATI